MMYLETLRWMYAHLPMYQHIGKSAYRDKLDNILAFCTYLGRPEKQFKSIHVGGTNGKGSTSHALASVLQEAGYKVGLYTSPHLRDFRERIRINGKKVSRGFVVEFIAQHSSFLEEQQLSFFEMTVGMAFAYFASQKVDIAVIEVGLGGRLDSTNIIIPEVSVITNIGYDHTDILGDTLPKIAFEKAGIIKPGVPVVVSEYQEETFPVFSEMAAQRQSPLVVASQSITTIYETDLKGGYQAKNMKGVVAALKELKGFVIAENHLQKGLLHIAANTGLQGRWQQLKSTPMVICDTAHNREGLEMVFAQIKEASFEKLHVVFGMVKDKDWGRIAPILPDYATYYFCCPNVPRGLDVKELKERAMTAGLTGKAYISVNGAYRAALRAASKKDFIYIGGSTFVVAEVV